MRRDPAVVHPALLDATHHARARPHELQSDQQRQSKALRSAHLTRLALEHAHQLMTDHAAIPGHLPREGLQYRREGGRGGEEGEHARHGGRMRRPNSEPKSSASEQEAEEQRTQHPRHDRTQAHEGVHTRHQDAQSKTRQLGPNPASSTRSRRQGAVRQGGPKQTAPREPNAPDRPKAPANPAPHRIHTERQYDQTTRSQWCRMSSPIPSSTEPLHAHQQPAPIPAPLRAGPREHYGARRPLSPHDADEPIRGVHP
jgi:hypothetical protein